MDMAETRYRAALLETGRLAQSPFVIGSETAVILKS